MHKKDSLKWLLLAANIVEIIFLAIIIYLMNVQIQQDMLNAKLVNSVKDITSKDQIETELPIHLRIPKINVDASVESVGLTPDGAMGIPSGPATVSWYNLGPRPGEMGSAVMSGHYGWKNNIPAVFDNLSSLQKGDQIYVEDENEVTTIFVVSDIQLYDKNANDLKVFSSNDGRAHLNLITCEGIWDKAQKSYSNRLIIFADKE